MSDTKIYNKLVRDKIPDIIEKAGKSYEIHIADTFEYEKALHNKLLEEVNEFIQNPCEEELADILEVIDAIIENKGFSVETIESVKKEKGEIRGKFTKRIILEKVFDRKEENK